MPENIGKDTLFMFYRIICKDMATSDFQVLMAAILYLVAIECDLSKNAQRIGFLMPENIGKDTSFMFYHIIRKNIGSIRFSGSDGGHLGFK